MKVGLKLARKALGFRYLMDVIPLDANLVRGSHGRPAANTQNGPLLISSEGDLLPAGSLPATGVAQLILDHLFVA